MLSRRGEALASSPPMPSYLVEHFARSSQPYHAEDSPSGYIPMCIAENTLVWDLIKPMVNRDRCVPPAAFGYGEMVGSEGFREALAVFLGEWVFGREVLSEQIVALAGAGSVLEILFHALADEGEGVLVPTPSYAGFWMDLETRDGLTLVPVHGLADEGFRVSPIELEAALQAATVPVRALLFTSPNNPLGAVYGPDELEVILAWAQSHEIHVVMDEVYALSVHGERPFTSAAALARSLGDRVHIVWAFSKDFAASGLRCGVLITENERVRAAVSGLAYWSCVSGDTQHLLTQWLSDEAWLAHYVGTMRLRLKEAYDLVTARLDDAGVPYLSAEAGFFLVVDLRAWLTAPTWEAEELLWRRLLDEANLNLTPGAAMRGVEPGLFRLCFASVPSSTLAVALDRLGEVLER